MRAPFLMVIVVASLSACSHSPPLGWAEGGARLVLARAVWTQGDEDPIEIGTDGKVTSDGDVLFMIDGAGRVFDEEREAIAVLLPDGHLGGNDDTLLGRVGVTNASPPGRSTAWISILPDGNILFFDSEGERSSMGRWQGCHGPQLRTCTLVTHLVALNRAIAASRSHVSVGVGIGVWR